jgi:hypothetical protein
VLVGAGPRACPNHCPRRPAGPGAPTGGRPYEYAMETTRLHHQGIASALCYNDAGPPTVPAGRLHDMLPVFRLTTAPRVEWL